MQTITKKDLVGRIAEKTQSKHITVKAIVQQFLDEIISELSQNNRLEFRDFGVFEINERAARMALNPKTLEPVKVPAKRSVGSPQFISGRAVSLTSTLKELQRLDIPEVLDFLAPFIE